MRTDRSIAARTLIIFAIVFLSISSRAWAGATFSIGGKVSGLVTGDSVTLLDNGVDSLPVKANGSFTFKTKLATGAKYNVTVSSQPTGEICSVTQGSGTVAASNIGTVNVT